MLSLEFTSYLLAIINFYAHNSHSPRETSPAAKSEEKRMFSQATIPTQSVEYFTDFSNVNAFLPFH